MDGTAAIERNREALKGIVASLFVMAGKGIRGQFASCQANGVPGSRSGATETGNPSPHVPRPTLPRHLRLALLRLLRPAEAAARRLVIALARGIAVTLPAPRPCKPAAKPVFVRRGGTGVVLPPGAAIPAWARSATRAARPPGFALLDPLRKPFRPRRPVSRAVPRICVPGFTTPVPPRAAPHPNDPVEVARLGHRLAALRAALDDLPAQARRFARWRARRAAGRVRRVSPLRAGRPPGGRLARFDPGAMRRRNTREVDEVLAHAHALALYALDPPDTS